SMGYIHSIFNCNSFYHLISKCQGNPLHSCRPNGGFSMRLAVPQSAASASFRLPMLIMLFCILWSSAFAVAKVAMQDCPPLLLLTARFLLAGAIMLGAAAVLGRPWQLGRRDLLVLAGLGIVNNALYLGLNYVGRTSVSAGLSALIVSSSPVL